MQIRIKKKKGFVIKKKDVKIIRFGAFSLRSVLFPVRVLTRENKWMKQVQQQKKSSKMFSESTIKVHKYIFEIFAKIETST